MPVNIQHKTKLKFTSTYTNIENIFSDQKHTLKTGAYATFNNK